MPRRPSDEFIPNVKHYCGFCGQGDHSRCPGPDFPCSCASTEHEPDDKLAASMRLYQRGDLVGDTIEHLAAEYRAVVDGRQTGRNVVTLPPRDPSPDSPIVAIADQIQEWIETEADWFDRTLNPLEQLVAQVPDTPRMTKLLPLP